MENKSSNKNALKYKKAIKIGSQPGVAGFSFSHAPAVIVPLLFGTFLLSIGMPMIKAVLITFWLFTAFLFSIQDKPERFIRRMIGSRKKHWKRKLYRSKSLFDEYD